MASCSPTINTSMTQTPIRLADESEVVIIPENMTAPVNHKMIGTTKVGDSGFTVNCGLDVMINLMKNEARKNGANALKITKHILPSPMGSTCHRLTADLLVLDDVNEMKRLLSANQEVRRDKGVKDSLINTNDKTVDQLPYSKKTNDSKIVFFANLGRAYRIASAPDGLNVEQENYIRDLKSGISYELSGYYLSQGTGGFGLKYNLYNSNGVLKNQQVTFRDGTSITTDISDNITIQFIGPSMIIDDAVSKKIDGTLEFALGYMSYKNTAGIASDNIIIRGGTLGAVVGLGFHYKITQNFLVGPQINFIGGVLNSLTYNYSNGYSEKIELRDEEKENLWRIDLAIGAKLKF